MEEEKGLALQVETPEQVFFSSLANSRINLFNQLLVNMSTVVLCSICSLNLY